MKDILIIRDYKLWVMLEFFLNFSLQKYWGGSSLDITVQISFLCLAEVPSKQAHERQIYTEKVVD